MRWFEEILLYKYVTLVKYQIQDFKQDLTQK